MIETARVQAAIEILDLVIVAARDNGPAADTLIARYFRDRRYAGSKDRRAIRDLVYAAIRRAGERPVSGRAAMLGLAVDNPALEALFDGSPRGPDVVVEGEPRADSGFVPQWLTGRMAHLGEDGLAALSGRASLDLRVNRLKASRADILPYFTEQGGKATEMSADGIRFEVPFPVESHRLHQDGVVEIQDEGSQLISDICAVKPGMTVVDLCAGAGGKTLALAAAMENTGRIIACDTDRGRLSRLPQRAERAGVSIIETRLLDPGKERLALTDIIGTADVVLIDAPCSGTGTWRRNPESRWRLTPARLNRLATLQAMLLALGAELVAEQGRLVYAVCSLLREEGALQLEKFLATSQGWTPDVSPLLWGQPAGGGRVLTPARDLTDGFYVAAMKRT